MQPWENSNQIFKNYSCVCQKISYLSRLGKMIKISVNFGKFFIVINYDAILEFFFLIKIKNINFIIYLI